MTLLLSLAALAQEPAAPASAPTCDYTSMYGVIDDLDGPAVLVLGERRGVPFDANRAAKLVRTLLRRGDPVTVALMAVDRSRQSELDDWAAGRLGEPDLPERLGFADPAAVEAKALEYASYPAYADLLETGKRGAHLVAAGLPYGLRPADAEVPVPPYYTFQLSEALGDHGLPVDFEETYTAAMAWRGYAVAQASLAGWDGQGWLVVVADRALVEGGLGVGWQAQRQTEAPVRAALLANAGALCYPGDLVWRDLLGR